VGKTTTISGINVRIPNASIITSTHAALLDLPTLPPAARQAHLFPDLSNSALLSISQFCDHGFEAPFDSKTVCIMCNNTVILQGSRDSATGLWQPFLQPSTLPHTTPLVQQVDNQPSANNVHELTVKQDIMTYLHSACFSLVPSTSTKAIDAGHFTTWPGLTMDLVRKHLAKYVATSKGHMQQECQHLQSTQPLSLPLSHSEEAKIATAETPAIGGMHDKAAYHE
jgi:hypothetical protein